jgi:fermentation-respiration switch protein FrsA (DUF1100 family)
LTAVKELHLDSFGRRFQGAGFTVLVYDNRHFGDSSGFPRFEVDPIKQIEDYHDAITWVSTLPEVDSDRIAIWGSSYSGGNVIHVGSVDRRIKAVIAQVPFVSGQSNAPGIEPLLDHIIADRVRIRDGEPGQIVKVVADSLEEAQSGKSESILPTPDAYEYFVHSDSQGHWQNKMTLQSLFKLVKNEPRAYVHRISPTPLFMCIAENDLAVDVPTQIATFESAKEPKELLFMPQTGHFDVYSGLAFETNVEAQIKFLKKHL